MTEVLRWTENLLQHGLDPIFLVAPTTANERLAHIAQQARGFIYAVSRGGVTGPRDAMTRDAETLVKRVRSVTDVSVAVGFGVSTAEQACKVWRLPTPPSSTAPSFASSNITGCVALFRRVFEQKSQD